MRKILILLAALVLFLPGRTLAGGFMNTLNLGLGIQGGDPVSVLDLKVFPKNSIFYNGRIGVFFNGEISLLGNLEEDTVGFFGLGHHLCASGQRLCGSYSLGVARNFGEGDTELGARLGVSYPLIRDGMGFEVRADTFIVEGEKPFWTVSFGVFF